MSGRGRKDDVPTYAAYGSNMHPSGLMNGHHIRPMSGTGWLNGLACSPSPAGDIGWEGALATVAEDQDNPDAGVRRAL